MSAGSAASWWPCLAAFGLLAVTLAAAPAVKPITIHLAGDSTMAAKQPEKRPETGWGERLSQCFREDRVRVVNHALNGRSTRTFISEGLWDGLLAELLPGDFVLIQFGHNDESKEKLERYTTPDQFKQNLTRFVADVRKRRSTPILMTPVMRRRFDATGAVADTHGEYPGLVRAVAAQTGAALVDMHRLTAQSLTRYGPAGSRELFLILDPGEHPNYPQGIEDNTHSSPRGALLNARLVAEALRGLGTGLEAYLR